MARGIFRPGPPRGRYARAHFYHLRALPYALSILAYVRATRERPLLFVFFLLLFEATYREPAFQLHRSGWCAHQAAAAGDVLLEVPRATWFPHSADHARNAAPPSIPETVDGVDAFDGEPEVDDILDVAGDDRDLAEAAHTEDLDGSALVAVVGVGHHTGEILEQHLKQCF